MIQKLEKYLIDLMHQHDCVVIPDVGGLVANYTPGMIDDKSNRMHPPKKGFIWNHFLKHNDGLLTHHISKVEKVSYNDATVILRNMLSEFEIELKENSRLEFQTIGVFYVENGKTKLQAKKDNYLLSSFGLPIVKAIPLVSVASIDKSPTIEKSITPTTIVVEDAKTVEKKGKIIAIQEANSTVSKKVKNTNSKWWIAAALIPIGFYTAWIPMKTDLLRKGGNFQYSDLNPFTYTKVNGVYVASNQKFNLVDTTIRVDYTVFESLQNSTDITSAVEPEVAIESTYVDVATPETEYVEVTQKTYFVIGGCFSEKDNALNFVADLKSQGFDAKLVDYNKGLHRVAFGVYTNRKDAKQAKAAITADGNYSAWVLKKEQ